MTHALRFSTDDFHQRSAGICFQEGSQTDALHRLFMLLCHVFAWKGALGYTRLKGKKGAGEKDLGEYMKAPVNYFFTLTISRSYTEGRGNHSLACRGYWAACQNQNSRDIKTVMRKLENNERYLHRISQSQNACTANFTVINARSSFGSVRNNLHSLQI